MKAAFLPFCLLLLALLGEKVNADPLGSNGAVLNDETVLMADRLDRKLGKKKIYNMGCKSGRGKGSATKTCAPTASPTTAAPTTTAAPSSVKSAKSSSKGSRRALQENKKQV